MSKGCSGSSPSPPALKTIPVTRTWPGAERRLSVHRLERASLERHRYGFLQPPATAPEVDPATVDLVLVPGLAFDVAGGRLGYGLGYYDRLLPRLDPAAPRVGVALRALVVPALPADPRDVAMTHLATESGVAPTEAGE